jgi:hypothetical protein
VSAPSLFEHFVLLMATAALRTLSEILKLAIRCSRSAMFWLEPSENLN